MLIIFKIAKRTSSILVSVAVPLLLRVNDFFAYDYRGPGYSVYYPPPKKKKSRKPWRILVKWIKLFCIYYVDLSNIKRFMPILYIDKLPRKPLKTLPRLFSGHFSSWTRKLMLMRLHINVVKTPIMTSSYIVKMFCFDFEWQYEESYVLLVKNNNNNNNNKQKKKKKRSKNQAILAFCKCLHYFVPQYYKLRAIYT